MGLRDKIREYRRVVEVSRKPSKEEFKISSKICAIGLAVIGAVGFVIFFSFILLGI